MSKKRKLLEKILTGSKNIRFDELVTLVGAFGFTLSRINGSHHIFTHPEVPEIVNLQNKQGKAVPYGHLEKLPYCKQTKAESAALP
jgi:predicted RNA binding protein YcfA (HicA-like mRNA interferase family)